MEGEFFKYFPEFLLLFLVNVRISYRNEAGSNYSRRVDDFVISKLLDEGEVVVFVERFVLLFG